jgi:hypothetical protein
MNSAAARMTNSPRLAALEARRVGANPAVRN